MLKGKKAPTTVSSLCACHKGQVRPCLEISKDQCEGFTKWISKYCYASGFCTLKTTGTDVHGIMPTSVITMETKWGGVTSYTKFKRWSDLTSLQSDKTSALSLVSGTKSSGSPVNKQTTTVYSMNDKNDFKERKRLNEICFWFNLLSSLETKESVCTLSQNLYVSQQTSTGTFDACAIIATIEEPTRDLT